MVQPVMLEWTIWRFSGITVPQEDVTVALRSEPNEITHEYQRVLGRVQAYSAKEALRLFVEG